MTFMTQRGTDTLLMLNIELLWIRKKIEHSTNITSSSSITEDLTLRSSKNNLSRNSFQKLSKSFSFYQARSSRKTSKTSKSTSFSPKRSSSKFWTSIKTALNETRESNFLSSSRMSRLSMSRYSNSTLRTTTGRIFSLSKQTLILMASSQLTKKFMNSKIRRRRNSGLKLISLNLMRRLGCLLLSSYRTGTRAELSLRRGLFR